MAIADLNSMGARNFNQGIRAYYFAAAALVWFWSPIAAIVATLVIAMVLLNHEFFSSNRLLVSNLHQHDMDQQDKQE